MGNKSSLLLREEEIQQLQEETGCVYIINWVVLEVVINNLFAVTPNQIERLYSRFTALDRGDCGTLSRDDLLRIPEIAINPLGERIVNSFFQGDVSDRVNFRQFLTVLAHFRPIKKNKDNKNNSREQKLRCKYPFSLLLYCMSVISNILCWESLKFANYILHSFLKITFWLHVDSKIIIIEHFFHNYT